MAAPILWAPGKFAFSLQEKPPHAHKFLVLGRGRGILGFGFAVGEGGADSIFMGARFRRGVEEEGAFVARPTFGGTRLKGVLLTCALPPESLRGSFLHWRPYKAEGAS